MNAIEQTVSAPPRISWLKEVVRYGLHLIILYQVVGFSANSLAVQIYTTILLLTHGPSPSLFQTGGLLFSYLLAFSMIPAFVAGLLINARFRHRVAEYIWMIPIVILTYAFFFHGPGMYPTMLGDSDFPKAFHFFFGGGLHLTTGVNSDWYRAYMQLRFTAPAYGAIAYSFGALLGMNTKSRALQTFMERF